VGDVVWLCTLLKLTVSYRCGMRYPRHLVGHVVGIVHCCDWWYLIVVGHSRAGKVPYNHIKLLQRSTWHHCCVRCDRPGKNTVQLFYVSDNFLSDTKW